MNRRTDDPYFDWLCIKIGVDYRNPKRNYGQMMALLHGINYIPCMELDENRGVDGIQLRVDFMNIHGEYGSSTHRGPCTMLEFLIALAAKMNFLIGEDEDPRRTEWYFWKLIRNVGLRKYTDDYWDECHGEFFVEDAVDRILNRKYEANGYGGLFPLRHPTQDQRCTEIWNQMHAWLGENADLDLYEEADLPEL